MLSFVPSGDIIDLKTGGSTRLSIQNSGVIVTGVSTFAGITTVTGNTLFTKQLSVSGVTTFTGNLNVTGGANFTKSSNNYIFTKLSDCSRHLFNCCCRY